MTSPAITTQDFGARMSMELSFQRDPASTPHHLTPEDAVWPRRLRWVVRGVLGQGAQARVVGDAETLVSELVTNALRHGGGDIRFRMRVRGGRVLIEVRDGSSVVPRVRHASVEDEHGRGLVLVDALADEWGVSADGTTIWCALPLPAP
ncbi:ATP-binding protein [Streptomyces sp. NPDC048290]|uniref:ATP-binding protein n=1 Tax=Streptomyces sp. NPDC048290 TaxID=3155811 RepID=UPI0034478252